MKKLVGGGSVINGATPSSLRTDSLSDDIFKEIKNANSAKWLKWWIVKGLILPTV